MWTYIAIGAVSGAVWSLTQFGKKVFDRKKEDRWKDFDLNKFLWTTLLNAGGAALGVWALPYVADVEVNAVTAVASGVWGEKVFQMFGTFANNILPK